jgi:adenylate cyclase
MVRSNFERYFAPNIAAEIAQQDTAVPLGGDRRPITVLFSDIRGFTSMAESMGPDAIAQLLTEYFSEMVEIIYEHGGTLDKFVGDAIMALWGAPIAHADDADRALRDLLRGEVRRGPFVVAGEVRQDGEDVGGRLRDVRGPRGGAAHFISPPLEDGPGYTRGSWMGETAAAGVRQSAPTEKTG